MSYDLGAPVPLTMTVKDASGAPANSGNMRLVITLPDDSTAVVDPVAPSSTGSYAYRYPTTQVGRHAVRWLGTGANPAAYTDVFDVRPTASLMLFSLADGKAQLDIPAASTGDDDELRHFIEATTAAVEYFVGPVVPRVVEQVLAGDRSEWVLHSTPVMVITAVTAIGTWQSSIDLAALDFDPETGVVRRTDGVWFYSGDYRVAYKAGRTVVSPNIPLAGKLILQHLWRTQYGAARGPSIADDVSTSDPIPGFGYAIPNRALELLENDRQMGGFA